MLMAQIRDSLILSLCKWEKEIDKEGRERLRYLCKKRIFVFFCYITTLLCLFSPFIFHPQAKKVWENGILKRTSHFWRLKTIFTANNSNHRDPQFIIYVWYIAGPFFKPSKEETIREKATMMMLEGGRCQLGHGCRREEREREKEREKKRQRNFVSEPYQRQKGAFLKCNNRLKPWEGKSRMVSPCNRARPRGITLLTQSA